MASTPKPGDIEWLQFLKMIEKPKEQANPEGNFENGTVNQDEEDSSKLNFKVLWEHRPHSELTQLLFDTPGSPDVNLIYKH